MAGKINFTKAEIKRIAEKAISTGMRLRVSDERTRGLLVDATPKGNVSFHVCRRKKGILEWQRLGEFGDKPHQLTVDQARNMAYEVLGELEKGKSPRQIRLAWRGEPTLREIFNQYIEGHAKERCRTWEEMVQSFERYVGQRAHERGLENLAERKASQITFVDIRRLKEKLKSACGSHTANRTLQLLRAVYNKAISSKIYAGENPVTGIGLYKEESRARFLSANEVKNFIFELSREPQDDIRDLIWLSLLTGARKSNVLSMQFSEIDFQKGTWTIPANKSKNGKSQIIALTGIEIKILNDRKQRAKSKHSQSDFVFPGEGRTGHLVEIKRSWKSLRKRAKLLDITVHDLRRNLGSWMAGQNVNLALIKGALNHADMKTTLAVYARTANDAEKEGRLKAHQAMLIAAGDAGKHLLREVTKELNPDRKVVRINRRTKNR